MLTNATWAPTHGMTQPWLYKVYSGKSLEELSDFMPGLYQLKTSPEAFSQAKYDKMKSRLSKASVVIIVCLKRDPTGKINEWEEIEAVACSVQNMALTATAYGLGTFWATPKLIYTSEMKEYLTLSERDSCLGLIYVGYLEGEWPSSHRRPLEYVTEWYD
jgi:nitroreductase